MIKKILHHKFRLLAMFSVIIIAATTLSFYITQQEHSGIYEVNKARDESFIKATFARDLYWLTTESSHDTEYMLTYKASSKSPEHKGNLTIKVAYEDNKPVGFVAYFKKNFYVGDVLFIDVEPEYRSHGWGYKLLDVAVKDLLQKGATKVELVTRTNNHPAQKLYTKYGFKETLRTEGFVYFEYKST